MFSMEDARAVLTKVWGYADFRAPQAQVVAQIATGKDVLAVCPTGAGKSIMFQVPALLGEGTTLVISPLIALMKDQVDDLRRRGVSATYVNSHVPPDEAEERLSDLSLGAYKLFYLSPEMLQSTRFAEIIPRTEISRVVVDESHSVAMDGVAFRPAYSLIKDVLEKMERQSRRPQVLAFTATATADIEADIVAGLGLREPLRYVSDPTRPNIQYFVYADSPWERIRALVREWNVSTGRYIVYCGTRAGAEKVAEIVAETLGFAKAEFSRGLGMDARKAEAKRVGFQWVAHYHAGMRRDDVSVMRDGEETLVEGRETVQENFKSGRKPVVVATCAFGMGIDVPNIRSVIHFGIPGSIEAYTQHSGRAGRDGLPSTAVLLVDDYSIKLQQRFVDQENPPLDLYAPLWRCLRESAPNGELIRESTYAIRGRSGTALDAETVESAINIMESSRLLQRSPMAMDGHTLILHRDALEKRKDAGVAKYLWDTYAAPVTFKKITLETSPATLAEAVKSTKVRVVDELRKLQGEKAVAIIPTYTGKSIRLLLDADDPWMKLPREELTRKRELGNRRLQSLLAYTRTADRPKFLRDYFMRSSA